MYLLLSAVFWVSASTISIGEIGQIPTVAKLLNRILQEGLSVNFSTTTDVYFVNFVQPEYVELQDAVVAGLRNTTTVATVFMNSRNHFARNRLFLLVAVPRFDEFQDSLLNILLPTITDQQLVENSKTIHVMVIILNFDLKLHQFAHLMSLTLSWLKTLQFIMVISTPLKAQILSSAMNLKIFEVQWNDSFHDMFYNKPFEDVPLQYFTAMQFVPRVIYRDGKYEGLDVTVFNTVFGYLNISYQIIQVSHTNLTETKKKIDKLLKNAAIGGMVNRAGAFVKSVASMALPYRDGLCILVPKSQRMYLFYHLLQPLAPSSWLMLGGLVFIGAFVSARWPKWFHQNLVLSLFCGSTKRNYQMHRTERFVVVGGAFLFTVLIEAYLAKFIFHMTTYRYEKDPQTIDEFIESPHMLLAQPWTVEIFTAIRRDLESKFIGVPDLDLDYDIINNTKYGYIMPCTKAQSRLGERAAYDRLIHGTNVRPSFHLVPEKLETQQLFYHFAPYLLYYAQFKSCFDRLFETGLTEFWEKNIERQYYVNPGYEFTDTVVLDMDRLQLLWIIYAIGNLLSVYTFICEILKRLLGRGRQDLYAF